MAKRILLIDDEELFLESLKEGLAPLDHIFETDICYSVNEAIKQVITRKYDIIITDLRMPGKSGLELLVYLRDIKYSGKIMVMSAYNTDENVKRIKSYGVIDIISKPFNLEWFKNKLLDILTTGSNENLVTFETVDLVTVMQIINMERKTAALEINMKSGTGIIFFEKGEIIHAKYRDLEGERAVIKIIALNQGSISIKAFNGNVPHTMQIPFVEHMMKIMRTIDELRRDQDIANRNSSVEENSDSDSAPAEVERKPEIKKEEAQKNKMKEKLAQLKDVKGYLGSGIFTPQGEMLEGSADISGIQFEEAGSLIHDTLKDSGDMSKEIGFGNLDMIQLYTQLGIVFAKCYNEGGKHFHTILVIKNDGNVAMARLKLNKVVETLIPEF